MFDQFKSKFTPENQPGASNVAHIGNAKATGYQAFMKHYAGASFIAGLYRVHTAEQANKFDEIVAEYFPAYKGRAACFGYDWLGRQFALDHQRLDEQGQPLVLLFEPGSGGALQIPATFLSFHNQELVEFGNAALAEDFFDEWAALSGKALATDECAGYKVPLFLGGEDDADNLETINMEVYWQVCAQLYNKTRTLPPGTTIGEISIES